MLKLSVCPLVLLAGAAREMAWWSSLMESAMQVHKQVLMLTSALQLQGKGTILESEQGQGWADLWTNPVLQFLL